MLGNNARWRPVCVLFGVPVGGLHVIVVLGMLLEWFYTLIVRGMIKGVGLVFWTEFRGAWILISGPSTSA